MKTNLYRLVRKVQPRVVITGRRRAAELSGYFNDPRRAR